MAFLSFLVLGFFVQFSVGGDPEIPVCDQFIISKIEQYWLEQGGAPTGILDTYISDGVEFAFASTERYFTLDTTCAYYIDHSMENGLHRTLVHMHYTDKAPTADDVNVYEQNGVTRADVVGALRYHIFLEKGVSCIYTCSDGANAHSNLPPAAVIKMSKDNREYAAADKCIRLLESWGIHVNRFYNDDCAENAINAPAPVPDYHGQSNDYEHI